MSCAETGVAAMGRARVTATNARGRTKRRIMGRGPFLLSRQRRKRRIAPPLPTSCFSGPPLLLAGQGRNAFADRLQRRVQGVGEDGDLLAKRGELGALLGDLGVGVLVAALGLVLGVVDLAGDLELLVHLGVDRLA